MENKNIDKPNNKYAESRRLWRLANKEKMALYSRNYYHKRCENDPDYKIKLCERKKTNNRKNGKNKSVGRPRIYTDYDPVSDSIL